MVWWKEIFKLLLGFYTNSRFFNFFFFFLKKGNPPESTEKLNNMTHCLSLCCWNRSSVRDTELSGKRYSGDLYSKTSEYYFTSIAKMAFDIMKKTQWSAMLGNWASQLVYLSVLNSFCGFLGVITCMPTHTLRLQTPLPRYNSIL